ncbi:hypothetical protein TRVA0_036S01244 [Trichomonascus vanleenenianus]|uniref:uncharacterized protein n=1 Tax=Trichomonascus vanleenenianus TaxID=2268995 RepID=UPI003ECB1DB9
MKSGIAVTYRTCAKKYNTTGKLNYRTKLRRPAGNLCVPSSQRIAHIPIVSPPSTAPWGRNEHVTVSYFGNSCTPIFVR